MSRKVLERLAVAFGIGRDDHLVSLLGAFEEGFGRKGRIGFGRGLEAGLERFVAARMLLDLGFELAGPTFIVQLRLRAAGPHRHDGIVLGARFLFHWR
nr:hypothetical protein [Devosia aurantiaca]